MHTDIQTNSPGDNASGDNQRKSIICVTCPKGCHLTVDLSTNTVTGNGCVRGEIYGLSEVRDPKRIITTTVHTVPAGKRPAGMGIAGKGIAGDHSVDNHSVDNHSVDNASREQTMLPVRSKEAIPKRLLFDAMKEINGTVVTLPVRMGQTIISNICGTGIDIIASRDLDI